VNQYQIYVRQILRNFLFIIFEKDIMVQNSKIGSNLFLVL
jgi:hypothetical protein